MVGSDCTRCWKPHWSWFAFILPTGFTQCDGQGLALGKGDYLMNARATAQESSPSSPSTLLFLSLPWLLLFLSTHCMKLLVELDLFSLSVLFV